MPLDDQQIAECHERYVREQDRYAKMAEVAYEKCLEIVQKKLTVRATVQRRAKSPKSFVAIKGARLEYPKRLSRRYARRDSVSTFLV